MLSLPTSFKKKLTALLHFEHVQSKNQVVILGRSNFEKSEKIDKLNCSADRVNKRPPSYYAIAFWTPNLFLYRYNSLDMSSKKMEFIW